MSLPTPNLDVRSFQQIVDDAKRQIGLHCPDWTDHNVSDPGVTLIELFASMTEMMLFRINQVPEKNYIKFLELLGIGLEAPIPARTTLRFLLSRAIEDFAGEENNERLLRARSTIAATQRTQFEESVEFTTDKDLRLVRPRLQFVFAAASDSEDDLPSKNVRDFENINKTSPDDKPFSIFSSRPTTGDSLYFGFGSDISSNIIQLDFKCVRSAATGLNEDYPAQVWEVWRGSLARWDRLESLEDRLRGFNQSGAVQLCLPDGLVERLMLGRRAYWIRCRYTMDAKDIPPRGPDAKRPDAYQKPPQILSAFCSTVGGSVPASNSFSILEERLGESDGLPGQVLTLSRSPVMTLGKSETLEVGYEDLSGEDGLRWKEWTCVPDFSASEAQDEHYVCDYLTGNILLGPSIIEPDGTLRQYGCVPPKGAPFRFSAYRVGGGTQGNVREEKIRTLKSAIPYIASVINPVAATGGTDRETLERAKLRVKKVLQVRNRAVTVEDFEILAVDASSTVGRACCLQPETVAGGANGLRPGLVRVLLVPKLPKDVLIPHARDLNVPEGTKAEVRKNLDERRLLTSTLEVDIPEYVFVSVDIRLVADPKSDADLVSDRVKDRIALYLHPLLGGPNGNGWPFRRALTLADLYAQVAAVSGVAFLLDARIYVSQIIDKNEWLLGPQRRVGPSEGIRLEDGKFQTVRLEDREGQGVLLGAGQLICSRTHSVRAVPLSAVGTDPGGDPAGV